jgi:hypothetical protein
MAKLRSAKRVSAGNISQQPRRAENDPVYTTPLTSRQVVFGSIMVDGLNIASEELPLHL